MPPSNLLTIYSLFQYHCAYYLELQGTLRIPRRGIRSKKEIKCFVQGAGVIRSECWLAECVAAHRKSGLFTVRFSGKSLDLVTQTRDQGSDLFAPSSPPTEGGGTLSSINPTQCIGECSITPSDFEGSADEDDDLELLVERIKSWSLSRDIFGELLDDMNFPELQDCAEIKNLTEAQWQDLLSFIQENTSILRFFKPRLHLLSTQQTSRKRRSWTLEAEQRHTNSKNSYNIMNT
ncbi:hypothetical protein C8Q72DRAFT_796705 [Fomitopsis betulina]|nr:hypothetical protein C8Q72DRAFT_796705 [Fomitopsis betulina]